MQHYLQPPSMCPSIFPNRDRHTLPWINTDLKQDVDVDRLLEAQPHTRGHYRIGAIRDMCGGRKLEPCLSLKLKEVYDTINNHPNAPDLGPVPENVSDTYACIEFHAATVAVRENIGSFNVTIWRHGNLEPTIKVR